MKILIGADIVPTGKTEQLFVDGDIQTLFGDVCEIIKDADRTVVNFECALTTAEKGIKKRERNLLLSRQKTQKR